MDRRTGRFALAVLLAIPMGFASSAPAKAEVAAEEKQQYMKILQTAAALKTKPDAYYEGIVTDLESRGVLGGHMDEFKSAAAGLFNAYQVEDYHRLFGALYSRGYEEEADFVNHTYVLPSKTLTPEEGVAKAQATFDQYENIRGRLTGSAPAASSAAPISSDTAAPDVKAPRSATEWPANIPFSRLMLKSGQTIDGHIVEEDDKGLWLETAPGAKVYFSKSEYTETKRIEHVDH